MYFTLNSVDIKIILQVYCYDFYIYPGNNIEENISLYTYFYYMYIFKLSLLGSSLPQNNLGSKTSGKV